MLSVNSPSARSLLVGLLLLSASPAAGYRREYRVTWDGERKEGAEVCFYRGASADHAFDLFFSHDRAACLPADQVLDLPPGLFHVFARHPDGYVSAHRDYFVYSGPPRPEQGYEELDIPLEMAGTLDLKVLVSTLKTGQSVGVWLAPTPKTRGTYFPLVTGETRMLVPAENPFLVLLIQGGQPVAVGEPLVLAAGEYRSVARFPAYRGTSDVVAWVRLDSAAADGARTGLRAPEIALVAQEQRFDAVFPLHEPLGATHTLVFFKNVPEGLAQLQVRGKTWLPAEASLLVRRSAATVAKEPLLLTPGFALTLSWNPTLTPALGDCDIGGVPEEARPRITATIAHCSDDQRSKCKRVASEAAVYEGAGTLTFESLPTATYVLIVEPPFAKATSIPIDPAVGDEVQVTLPSDPFNFFGTVSLNGQPLRARLIFESGETQSDVAGRYTASLAADPLASVIMIAVCADRRVFRHAIDGRIAPNAAYDVELSFGRLLITVLNTKQQPVVEAAVTFAPVMSMDASGPRVPYSSEGGTTDASGQTSFDVPREKSIILCARHRAYAPKCTAPLAPAEVAEGRAVIALEPMTHKGRISGHDGAGVLAWVNGRGQITEEVPIASDGTFSFRTPHALTEHLVYTSDRRPLAALPIPTNWREGTELALALPNAAVRSFTVAVPYMEGQSGFVGLWIGNLYVPLQFLAYHQEARGHDVIIYRGKRLRIEDVFETAPLGIAFAPQVPQPLGFTDIFTLPENTGIARHRVTGTDVTITP